MARLHAARRRFGRSDDAAPTNRRDAAFDDAAGARRGASLELARRSYSQPPDTIADAWEPPGQAPGGFLFGGQPDGALSAFTRVFDALWARRAGIQSQCAPCWGWCWLALAELVAFA